MTYLKFWNLASGPVTFYFFAFLPFFFFLLFFLGSSSSRTFLRVGSGVCCFTGVADILLWDTSLPLISVSIVWLTAMIYATCSSSITLALSSKELSDAMHELSSYELSTFFGLYLFWALTTVASYSDCDTSSSSILFEWFSERSYGCRKLDCSSLLLSASPRMPVRFSNSSSCLKSLKLPL